ncbi:neutral zinc metallopeptidase [uncultured Cedecea sp.]|uniref:neutral zinc metallopeptidase n=1 Tax=uncultured Cedecea sp. TaxID=988762 RepID=UPI0026232297|nr:neutral zinc metallopeptidase [uncultured Cedecea sp.]
MRQQEQPKNNHPEPKRRTTGSSAMRSGGGIFRLPRGKGFFILLMMVILASYYQSAILDFFTKKTTVQTSAIPDEQAVLPANEATEFTSMVVVTLDETWQTLFERRGLKYQPPRFVTYRDTVSQTCNGKNPASGTFYCSQDNTVYVSLTLYDNMQNVLGAGGDFTQGYVMAHAVGHHVQKLLVPGRSDNLPSVSPEQELQADCLAGLWGHRMAEQQILSSGDIETAINIAQVINKEQSQLSPGAVMPENFTYGTLQQRYQAFNQGFVNGSPEQCLSSDFTYGK